MNMRKLTIAAFLLALFAFAPVEAAVLTNGALEVVIRDDNGAIDTIRFGGSDFYNPGTSVSDYGFQLGITTSTFSSAETTGSIDGLSISSVVSAGDSIVVTGIYSDAGVLVQFVRTYTLVPDTNALEIQVETTNIGASPIQLRWFDTFDPDQGHDQGRGFGTLNDVFEISAGVPVGQASDTADLTVIMGSADPRTTVASGDPFAIDRGIVLNDFFSNPFDGDGSFDDSGTHVGGEEPSLGSGASTTFIYLHAYGLTSSAAGTDFLEALVNSRCFVIDAIDDAFSVIDDGTTTDFFVLDNDECNGDMPVTVVPQATDLMPDRGGVATTDGTIVRYAPANGFVGFEEFMYTAQDAGVEGGVDPPSVDQDTAAVTVEVLADLLPGAEDDEATTIQGVAVVVDVLANDAPGNAPEEVAIETDPANGTATVEADNHIRYVPNPGFFGADVFEYRTTDANGDETVAAVTVGVFFVSGEVAIDIIPNDEGIHVNLRAGQGRAIRIAIFSEGEFFDAPSMIDPLTLKFGPRQANLWGNARVRDVNGDGSDDLLVKFLINQTGIACGDSHATLSGRTFDSQPITGTDAVNTFNCPRVRKRY